MTSSYHPYHLVDYSPWPYTLSWGAFWTTGGAVFYFHEHCPLFMIAGLFILFGSMSAWFRDIVREATFQGCHTTKVVNGLRLGMILFIVSEVCFFFSFFWAFFHSSLSPSIELGCEWPPVGIEAVNPFAVPLLNTAILLSSGATVTWSHHAVVASGTLDWAHEWTWMAEAREYLREQQELREDSIFSLGLTIGLGAFFTLVQGFEYYYCPFTIADSVFGSCFFVATGFHGLHVLVGTIFLMVSWNRIVDYHFTYFHHFGFEASAWYWHFVDVVWLFLFICIYWWGS